MQLNEDEAKSYQAIPHRGKADEQKAIPACSHMSTSAGAPPRDSTLFRQPPLPIVPVLDNLAGHHSYDLVEWFFAHAVMPLYTPLGGTWLNREESVQHVLVRRALCGQHPNNAQEIIDWLEQTVEGWNGKRRCRRERACLCRLGGSEAALLNAS